MAYVDDFNEEEPFEIKWLEFMLCWDRQPAYAPKRACAHCGYDVDTDGALKVVWYEKNLDYEDQWDLLHVGCYDNRYSGPEGIFSE